MDYAKWRACERWGILPPDMIDNWDGMNNWQRAKIISYNQVRQYEDQDERSDELKYLNGVKM